MLGARQGRQEHPVISHSENLTKLGEIPSFNIKSRPPWRCCMRAWCKWDRLRWVESQGRQSTHVQCASRPCTVHAGEQIEAVGIYSFWFLARRLPSFWAGCIFVQTPIGLIRDMPHARRTLYWGVPIYTFSAERQYIHHDHRILHYCIKHGLTSRNTECIL